MPGALAGWSCPIDRDDLAGLAMDPLAESRLVFGEGDAASGYRLQHGPFEEETLSALPRRGWTLLVQGVEAWSAEIATLLQPYRFLPDWRIDDIMVSAAAPGGGVGPHVDAYDVFLVQGRGHRRWRLGGPVGVEAATADHPDLKLLARFQTQEEHLLGPGDVLYVPPGWAHWGIAEDEDCLTLSVGFRAPTAADGLGGIADELEASAQPLADTDRRATREPGRLATEDLDRLADALAQAVRDRSALIGWLGRWSTRPKRDETLEALASPITPEALQAAVASGADFALSPGHRLVYHRDPDGPTEGPIRVFLNGDELSVPDDAAELAVVLADNRHLPAAMVREALSLPGAGLMLAEFAARGAVEPVEGDAVPRGGAAA